MRLLTSFALLAASIPLSDAEGTIWGVTTNGGSLFGGTKLLIHGEGFSSMNGGTKTLVFVGTDECEVEPYFSSDNLITCYTAPAPKDQRGNWIAGQQLPIKVTNPTQLNTRQMYFVGSDTYKFTHSWDRTPIMSYLYPGGAQGKDMKTWGTFKTDTSASYRVSIDSNGFSSQCVLQPPAFGADENDLMDGNGWGMLRFTLGEGITSGRHNVTFRVDNPAGTPANGFALKGRRSLQVEPYSQTLYQFTAHPRVTAVSQVTSGLGGGQELTLEGSGFDWNKDNNKVFIGQNECNVTFASATSLRCIIPKVSSASQPSTVLRPAGRGMTHKIWYGSSAYATITSGRAPNNITTNTGNFIGLHINEPGIDYYVQELTGFFVPPVTAEYSFYLVSDDGSQIWMSSDANPANAKQIAALSGYLGMTWFGQTTQISTPQRYEAGKPYWMRVIHSDGSGGDFLNVALRIHGKNATTGAPNTAVDVLKGGIQKAYASLPEVQKLEIKTTVIREQQKITIAGAASGKMLVYWGQTGTMTSIPFDASASTFSSALSGFSCGNYAVTREAYNSTTLTNPPATGYAYTITLSCPLQTAGTPWPTIRLMSESLVAAPGVRDVELTSARIRDASRPVSGTFRLGVADGQGNQEVTAPIHFAAPSWVMEGALEALQQVAAMDVEIMGSTTTLLEGGTWWITFHAPNDNIPKLVVLTEDDAGFTTLFGESVTTLVTEVQDGSDDPFFNPAPMDFFRTAIAADPITVVSNGILGDCDVFVFDPSAPITTASSNASRACAFKYDASLTPSLGAVDADFTTNGGVSVYAGNSIVIQGSGFSTTASDNQVTIGIGTTPCLVTDAQATQLTCTLSTGVIGLFDVRVVVGPNKGLALPAGGAAWPQVRIGMRPTDFSPKTGSLAGGTLIEVMGSGFKVSNGNASEANTVLVGTRECKVISSTSGSIRCLTPAAVDQSSATSAVAITVDGVAVYTGFDGNGDPIPIPSFTYDRAKTPVVTAMTPTRVSAGITSLVNVTITGIPSAASVKSVTFDTRVCRIESIAWGGSSSSPSIITCTLIRGGARPLPQADIAPTVVVDGDHGFADTTTNNILLDDSFRVDSMSMQYGSLDGDNVITFTGTGFSPRTYANEVLFETIDTYGYKWLTPCETQELPPSADPTTTITCMLPSIPDGKRGDKNLWTATSPINGRFIVKTNNVTAPCDASTNGCAFTQRIESTPVVTSTQTVIDGTSPSGFALRLTGERLDLLGGGLQVKVGTYACAPNVAVSPASLTCQLPVGPASKVEVRASAGEIGDTRITAFYIFPFSVTDYTGPTLGSAAGGAILRIPGQGFAAGNLSANEVGFVGTSSTGVTTTVMAQVVSATTTELVIRTPPHTTLAAGSSQTFDVYVVNREPTDPAPLQPIKLASSFTYDYTTTVSAAVRGTPTVTNVSPLTGSAGTDITITGTAFGNFSAVVLPQDAPSSVMIGGVPCVLKTPIATMNSDTTIRCTVGQVPAGKHRILVYKNPHGYARNTIISVTYFTSTLTVTDVSPRVSGFGGGQLITITGKGFAPTSSQNLGVTAVGIGNRGCIVATATYDTITCRTSPLLTASSLNAFPVFDAAVLQPQTLIPNTLSSQQAYDGDVGTAFSGCAIVNDLGANSRAIVTGARAFPKWRSASLMANAVFQGSNDNTVWTTLGSIGSQAFEGWNNVQLVSSPGVTYLSSTSISKAMSSASGPVANTNGVDAATLSAGNNTVPSNQLGNLPSYRYLRFAFASGVTGGNCVGQEIEWQGFVIAAPSAATNNVDGLYQVEVTVNASQSLPAVFGGGATNILSVSAANTTDATAMQYSLAATPIIRSLSPNNGSSLGGTLVTLTGSSLPMSIDGIAELSLNGVPCAPQTASPTAITCITGPRGEDIMMVSVKLRVKDEGAASLDSAGRAVTLSGEALYNPSSVFFRYTDRWSALTTWKYQEPPVEGDTVVVPMGQSILVDISPPKLYLVLVEGELIFDDAGKDLKFEASYFIAHGGKISAGSVDRPYRSKLNIILHGERRKAVEIPDLGAKCLAVTSMGMDHDEEDETPEPGTVPSWHSKNAPRKRKYSRAALDLHGIPRKRVWTMLAQTALAGSNEIVMSEDVDWTVGETLVVTDNQNVWQSEEVVVAEVLGPRRLRLASPLENDHRSWFANGPNGVLIDERAEVGLLSRNIKVQGDDEFSDRDLFGVHIAAMHGDSQLRLTNIEITKAGQAGLLGRYPAHYHEIQEYGRDGVIIGNSIHHTYQRGTTVHNTHHVQVKHNFYFHNLGHTVFLEDGVEQMNFIEENLAGWTLPCHICTESDFKPASFWTASPTNVWRHNRAFGSTHFGFWFELPDRPLGPSFRPDYFCKQMPLLEFMNNTAHGNEVMGLRVYPGYNPRVTPGDDNSLALSMYIHRNTFTYNAEGTFHRIVGALHHVQSTFADNGQAFGWRQLEGGITLHSGNPFIKDSLFVCSSQGAQYCDWNRGIVAPQNEFWYAEGLTFYNYGATGRPLSGCHSCDTAAFMKQGAFTYRLSRLTFINSDKKISWNPPYKCIFQDLDGTLTGNTGSFGVPAGGWVVAPFAFNNFPACPKDQSAASVYENGNVCDNSVTVRKVVIDWHAPVELDYQTLNVTSSAGWDLVKFRPRERYGWAWPVVQRTTYSIGFTRTPPGLPLADWQRLRVTWGGDPQYIDTYNAALEARAAAASQVVRPADREWMGLTFSWAFTRYRNSVKYGGWINGGSLAGTYVERPNLPYGEMPGPAHQFGTGSLPGDQSGPQGGLNRTWTVVMSTINASLPNGAPVPDKYNLHAFAEQCPPNGCPDPSAMNLGTATLWSDPASWPGLGGRLPRENEDVVINGTSYIIMDLNPPKIGRLTIYGKLEFRDNSYRKLEAESIVVWGEFQIGSSAAPFQNQADVILHGKWPGNTLSGAGSNAPVIIDNNLFLGNKVMAVLGKVTMVAKAKPLVWTKLNATAAAGVTSIVLTQNVASSWLPGERIVLAATSFNQNSYETATITAVSGNTVTLAAPLRYFHFAGPAGTSGLAAGVKLQAAVGLLTRSVRFTSNLTSSDDTYGATLAVHGVTRLTTSGSLTTRRRIEGSVELRGIEFRSCGKLGTEYPALRLQYGNYLYDQELQATNPVNIIDGVSFTDSFNYALLAVSTKHLVLNRTVFYNSYRNGVDLDKQSWNATITGNLLVGNRKSPDVNAADQLQWIQPQTAFMVDTWAAQFRDNYASGCYDSAFTYRVPECSRAGDCYDNNEAVGVRIGAFLLPTATPSSCVKLNRFTVWKASHLGVISVDQISAVAIEGLTSVENHIGVSINYFGSKLPRGLSIGTVKGSTFIGSTSLLSPSCADSVCRAASGDDPDGISCGSVLGANYRRAGLLIPSYYNRGKTCDQDDELPVCNRPNFVSRLCALPWENRYGTIGKFDVQFHLTDVKFGGFALSECGNKRSSAIVHNPVSIDMSTPVYARGITWDTPVESRFHFDINFMTSEKCQGGIGCDGLGYVYLLDLDGSLLGRGAQATLIGDNPLAALPSPACQSFPTWKGILCSSAYTFRKAYLEGVEVGRVAMGLLQHTRLVPELENRTTMSVGSFKEECSMIGGQPFYAHFIQPSVDSSLFFPATEPSMIRYTVLPSPTDATSLPDGIVANLFIQRPYSWEVFVGQDGSTPGKDLSSLSNAITTRYPLRTDEPGSYLFVPGEKKLYFTVKPGASVVYTLVRKPAVQLSVSLKVSVEDFYNAKGAFLDSLSILLGIPSWRIKIVDVRAGSANVKVEISDEHPTVFVANTTTTDSIPADVQKKAEEQIQRLNTVVAKLSELASNGQLTTIAGIEVGTLTLIPPTSALVASTSPSTGAGGSNGGAPVTVLTPNNSNNGSPANNSLSGGAVAGIVIAALCAVVIFVGGFVFIRKRSMANKRVALRSPVGPTGASGSAQPIDMREQMRAAVGTTGSGRALPRVPGLGLRLNSKGMPIPSDDMDEPHNNSSSRSGGSGSRRNLPTDGARIQVNPGSGIAPRGQLAFNSKPTSPRSANNAPGTFSHLSPLAGRWEERHNKLAFYRSPSGRNVGMPSVPGNAAASSVLGNNNGPIAPARNDVSRTGSLRRDYAPMAKKSFRDSAVAIETEEEEALAGGTRSNERERLAIPNAILSSRTTASSLDGDGDLGSGSGGKGGFSARPLPPLKQ